MKKIAIVLFSCIVCFPTLSIFSAAEFNDYVNEEEIPIKVATYNMAAGRGTDGNYQLERIAETIQETGADIIGLQEVDVHWGARSNYDNTIQLLAEELDMYYYFAPIYDMEPAQGSDHRRQFGVAMLSKYPITNAANRQITRLSTQDPNPEPRLAPGFLEAEITIEGAVVHFYVTHLDYRSNPAIREMQVSDMSAIMLENNYNILVGDMNARPNAEELHPLFQWYDDAWHINDVQGYTYPSTVPNRRIDYIFTSPRMKIDAAQVNMSNASDHLPVTADVTILRENHSYSIRGMKSLIDYYEQRGDLTNQQLINRTRLHLDILHYYEEKNRKDKMIKHLDSFVDLLTYQKNHQMISDEAYDVLVSDTEFLRACWSSEK
ncbi:hypothetical protein GCM10008934_13030 [Virgibacillus salarius]|uniref:endonuclease/exonuclease/phosphatase family protein n=1 Tax=Virgibacillus salarius TaxID=447199 RepID=UPI0031E24F68